jgi:hypothetical protein
MLQSQNSERNSEATDSSLESAVVSYPNSNFLRLMAFSYLEGCDLFQKIAVTSMTIRKQLPESRLLNQPKVITIKATTDNYPNILPADSFMYAAKLATSIGIQIDADQLKYASGMVNIFQLVACNLPHLKLDVTVSMKEIG